MRRLVVVLYAALTAAMVLSSCGSSGTKAGMPVKAAPVEMAAETVPETDAEAEKEAEKEAVEAAAETMAAAAEETTAESGEAPKTAADHAAARKAFSPTGEPLTMPAMIPPQHTKEAPQAEQPAVSGAQAQNTGSQTGFGNRPPASRKATIMQVVNCKEWISLRTMPSTSAETITRIPLGEKVVWIGAAENGFYQINYQGNTGYALAEYLVQVQ